MPIRSIAATALMLSVAATIWAAVPQKRKHKMRKKQSMEQNIPVWHDIQLSVPQEMVYTPHATTFTLQYPTVSEGVKLRIYSKGQGGTLLKTVNMRKNAQGLWQTVVKGDLKDCFYTFELTGRNLGESAGIDAKAVGINGKRGAVIDWRKTNPEGWEDDTRPRLGGAQNWIIYELHHRDFSISPDSPIPHKGMYAALGSDTAVNYLVSLGVNAVHLLPSFDFGSIDEAQPQNKYNWGYDPLNYNVPEGSYASDAQNPATRIREFKAMVQRLHRAGIKVIMDVVYNHTYNLAESNFNRLYPGQFYRMSGAKPSNGSGCGNETASETAVMRDFMRRSVRYWAEEYHIDGFRFDLMGVHDIETMNLIRKDLHDIDPEIFVYGEGWSAGLCAYPESKRAVKANVLRMPGIAAFSDELRDALRGPFSNERQGAFLAGVPGNKESVKYGIVGAIGHQDVDMTRVNYAKRPWASQPTQMISYVSCHDDLCLTDRLRATIPNITPEELKRLDILAQTAVFTSQGVPFMLAGEEMLRNKKGVSNSYNAPDSINQLSWHNLERYPEVFSFYQGLIALRKASPEFRLGQAEAVRNRLHFVDTPENVVAWYIDTESGRTYVVLNAQKTPYTLQFPESRADVYLEAMKVAAFPLYSFFGKHINVPSQSALVMKVTAK